MRSLSVDLGALSPKLQPSFKQTRQVMQQHWEVRGWLRYASSYCPMSSNNTSNMALQLVYSSLHNKKCRAYYNSTEQEQTEFLRSLLSFKKVLPIE